MDSNPDDTSERSVDDREERFVQGTTSVEEIEPAAIGAAARDLDSALTPRERMRLPRATLRRLGVLGVGFALSLALMLAVASDATGRVVTLLPVVVLIALVFELLDSAAGMGFGTALAPLLFIMGYDPLQVVPALLISESLTGGVSGAVHHEFDNVTFSLRPLNASTKVALLIAGVGAVGSIGSIVVTYALLSIPDSYVETYVLFLVVLMGLIGLVRTRLVWTMEYNPRRLTAFVLVAGINKGVGGGGYGPVVTLGQILSGVYEKSATAITSLAESAVSLVGVATFALLATQGLAVDLTLLPSLYAGGFVAAVGAPYLVRIVPNRVLRYVIPLYALGIGLLGLGFGLGV